MRQILQRSLQRCSFAEFPNCSYSRRAYGRVFVQSPGRALEQPFVVPRSVDDTERLAALSHSVQHSRVRPNREAAHTQVRTPNAYGNWYCAGCCRWLPSGDYFRRTKAKSGMHSFCKTCSSNHLFRWKCTLRGFFKTLLASARSSAQKRALSGRAEAGLFELEYSALFDLLLRQEGRCAYSGVVLETRPLSNWQCSLERVDPSIGYVTRNVVLIACEFQSRSQWSWQKILSLPVPHHKAIPCCMGAGSRCFCKKLLSNAKSNSLRNHGVVRKNPREFSLTLKDLQVIVLKQRGRCAYSNIFLNFKQASEWMASLERLDNSFGYTAQNVALICHEFQSSDQSRLSTSERIRGSSQWSPSKASELAKWIQQPIVRQWITHQQALFAAPHLNRCANEGAHDARVLA